MIFSPESPGQADSLACRRWAGARKEAMLSNTTAVQGKSMVCDMQDDASLRRCSNDVNDVAAPA
eukprot:3935988-Rhodomonas_salina.2